MMGKETTIGIAFGIWRAVAQKHGAWCYDAKWARDWDPEIARKAIVDTIKSLLNDIDCLVEDEEIAGLLGELARRSAR